MNILKSVMFAAMVLFAPVHAFSSNLGYMRINHIEGDVQVKTPETEDWGFAYKNGPLAEGDQVWTPRGSRAELQLNNGSYIRLDEGSALQILSMDRDSTQFYLSQGRAYISFDAPSGSVIQFDTPDASVRAFNRGNFRVDISEQYTDVAVYKGFVKTENSTGITRINAGEMLSIGQNTNGEIAQLGPADEWEDWNNQRNHRIMARRDGSARYLPAELSSFSADLDENGRWVQVPEYGYVWSPTVASGSDWAPYHSGRWIWRGGDYVWVGNEPWGWAPYHYGRWAFVASFGWCWVPPVAGDVYWSPGYVGWVRTPEYVAWVPLAPGEMYYGRGNFGRHSVNITNVNITQVNVTNVYRNVQINKGVTVVNRNSFNTASPTMVNINRNIIQQKIFVKNNVSIGAPQIKPTRGSYLVSTRPVPPGKLPPQPVRNIRVGELKQSRPLIREPERSVLNPGAKIQPLNVTSVSQPRTPGRERPRLQNTHPQFKGGQGPAGAPVSKGEIARPQTLERGKNGQIGGPMSRVEKPQLQPRDNRQAGSPAIPGPRGEKPKVQDIEVGKNKPPAGQPTKGGRPQDQFSERRRLESPVVFTPGGDKPQPQSIVRGKSIVQGKAATIDESPRFQPGQGRQAGAVTPVPRGEKPKVQDIEVWKNNLPSVQPPKVEKPRFQPANNRQVGVPAAPGPRGEKSKVQTIDRGKEHVPNGAPKKDEKPKIQPPEKGERGAVKESGIRGEKKPDDPFEGNRKYQ